MTEEPTFENDVVTGWEMVDVEGWLCRWGDDESCAVQVDDSPVLKCGNLGKDYRTSPRVLDAVIDQESIAYGIVGFNEFGQGMSTIF